MRLIDSVPESQRISWLTTSQLAITPIQCVVYSKGSPSISVSLSQWPFLGS